MSWWDRTATLERMLIFRWIGWMKNANTADPDIRRRVTSVIAHRRVSRDERRRLGPTTQPLSTPTRPPGPIGGLRLTPALHKAVVLGAVVVPFLATGIAIVQLWQWAVSWFDLILLVTLYVPITLGVTAGFHRMLTHRSFRAHPVVRGVLLVCGSVSAQLAVTLASPRRPGGCVTPAPSRLYWASDPSSRRTGTAIRGVLCLWRGESPRGQVLQRVRGGPGGHVRLVRPGQPVPQPFLRWVRPAADGPGTTGHIHRGTPVFAAELHPSPPSREDPGRP